MKLIDSKNFLLAVEQIHRLESWEKLGAACPKILDDLIGADLSCWNVMRGGAFVELAGSHGYNQELASRSEALTANMKDHAVVNHTGVFSGELTPGSHKMSDYIAQRDYEKTGLYRDAYRHLDARYQMGTQVLVEENIEVILTVNRRHRDFNDDSINLLEDIKKHFAIACVRLLRERELKERVTMLMDHASFGAARSLTLDQHGKVVEIKGEVDALLARHFKCVRGLLPATLKEFLSKQKISKAANRRTVAVADDFGGSLKLTLLQTGYATRLTLLFHGDGEEGSVLNGGSINTLHKLSRRERDVLHWIAEGKSNPEISILLAIAVRTVDKHCENIYQKLGVENRVAAAREWLSSQ